MKILRSLAVKQAIVAVAIGFIVSIALSALEVTIGFRREAGRLRETALHYIDASSHAAALAAYGIDPDLATRVATGLVQTGYFSEVRIYDDFGTPLAREGRDDGAVAPHIFMWFDRRLATVEEKTLRYGSGNDEIGRIVTELSVAPYVERFRTLTYSALIRHAAGSLLLILLLGYFFYLWITKPVLKLAREVESLDLSGPMPEPIREPKGHSDDEIGLLARILDTIATHAVDANRQRTAYERQLRESESRFRRIYDNVQDGYYETDIRGNLLEVSPSFEKMTGYTRNELIGRSVLMLYESPRDRDRMIDSVIEAGRLMDYEVTLVRKNGDVFRCSLQAKLSEGPNGKPVGMIGSVRDISARKKAEARVRASLAEKEMLLREIHHRVKNNLQIISSLLHLQEGAMAGGDERPFLDSQNRIAAMALLHEELYESDTLSNVDLRSYVTKLAGQLAQAYDPSGAVALTLELDDIHMQMDAAVPCGLIINELVTNSFKHAFPGGSGGTLTVELIRTEPGRLRLSVADSGDGYPEDLDTESMLTLGMSLVQSLAEQLEGSVNLENRGGAYCSIDFPVPPLRVPI